MRVLLILEYNSFKLTLTPFILTPFVSVNYIKPATT